MSGTEDIEVIEVVLSGGAGFTVRSLSMDEKVPPMLAVDGGLVLFPDLSDLVAFAATDAEHTLTDHQSWAAIVGSAASGALTPELLDSYDLTEVPDLVTGDSEDRWTAGLLVTLALDISDTVGCPPLEKLGIDSPIIVLEGDSSLFEGSKNSMLRRQLADQTDRMWPGVLGELEARASWWSNGRTLAGPPERAVVDARRLAAAEAAVAAVALPQEAPVKRVIPVPLEPKGEDFKRMAPERPTSRTIDPRTAPKAPAPRTPPAPPPAPAKAKVRAPEPVVTQPNATEPEDDVEPSPLWDGVDAYPIEIHLPGGVGLTVVGYPDDVSTVFLGTPGEVLVFRDRGALVTYLAQTPGHSLAGLPGWTGMGRLDAADLEPSGFYYLHDLGRRLDDEDLDEDGCSEIADALEIAVELGQQLGRDEVLDELDGTGPLNLYVAALLDPDAEGDFPDVEDAAAQWDRVVAVIDGAVTWRG